MTVALRPFQADLKRDILMSWGAGAQNVLAVLPTGGGKTVVFSDLIANNPGASVAIAHRQELVSQISMALARNGVRHRIIGPPAVARTCTALHVAELKRNYIDPSNRVAVAGVDTLIRMEPDAWMRSVGLVVTDECFVAGTLVDGRPIETICVGDYVTAFDEHTGGFHARKVLRVFKNKAPKRMVRVTIAHHVINCTPAHPWFTLRGWVNAGDLQLTDKVLRYEVRNVRWSGGTESGVNVAVRENEEAVLQQGLQRGISVDAVIGNDGKNEPKICVGTNDAQQPDAKRGNDCQSSATLRAIGHKPVIRGDRSTPGTGGTDVVCDVRLFGVCDAARDTNGPNEGGVCVCLQARLGSLATEDCDRCGRGESSVEKPARPGCEKGRVPSWVGVDRVEIYERRDSEPAGSCGDDGHVFNLEVDQFHTYLVDGIVVHNCHHVLRKNKWGSAMAMFPNARGLGVTATPCRADGNGLGRHADGVMDHMIVGPNMRELIHDQWLTDYRIFAPPSDINLTDVPLSASGDFSPPKLATAVHKSHIVGDVVQHYRRIADGKLGVTFAVDVASAGEIASAYRMAGIPAEVVSAKTPDAVRASVLRRFRNREILQLVNVDLFGEGFDLPAIEVVSMARPTQSYGLFCQQFGRSLRPMEGKSHAIVIDHVGNVHRHGLPDAPRVWSLDRRERRSSSGVADIVPTRTCPQCTAAYERVRTACPFCGYAPEPAGRSSPEQVDGDLYELTGDVLARLRGQIDAPPTFPYSAGPEVIGAIKKHHRERGEAQAALRAAMAQWGGIHTARGDTVREAQRRFFLAYGIDVGTAQTLGRRDAEELTRRIT